MPRRRKERKTLINQIKRKRKEKKFGRIWPLGKDQEMINQRRELGQGQAQRDGQN